MSKSTDTSEKSSNIWIDNGETCHWVIEPPNGPVSMGKCKKCGTVLPDSERLKKHQEKAHNKKKEKCRACGAEFDYSEELRKHKKNCK